MACSTTGCVATWQLGIASAVWERANSARGTVGEARRTRCAAGGVAASATRPVLAKRRATGSW